MSTVKKSGLGRGFDALIPQDFDKSLIMEEHERIEKIAIKDLQPNPDQPRQLLASRLRSLKKARDLGRGVASRHVRRFHVGHGDNPIRLLNRNSCASFQGHCDGRLPTSSVIKPPIRSCDGRHGPHGTPHQRVRCKIRKILVSNLYYAGQGTCRGSALVR